MNCQGAHPANAAASLNAGSGVELVTVSCARAALGVDEDRILQHLENGTLLWGWDISVKGSAPRQIRIWMRSLSAFVRGEPQPTFADNESAASEVIGAWRGLRWVECTKVRLSWCCSQQTLSRLAKAGRLRGWMQRQTLWIELASLKDFLVARRVS